MSEPILYNPQAVPSAPAVVPMVFNPALVGAFFPTSFNAVPIAQFLVEVGNI